MNQIDKDSFLTILIPREGAIAAIRVAEEINMQEAKPIDLTSGKIQTFQEKDVWEALKECYDPEIPVNIVDLGLVYEVKIDGSTVNVKMTLTAPGCAMGPVIGNDVKTRLLQIQGVESANVQLVFSPMWDPSMMTEDAKNMLGIS
jgi:metal-sulfur cluster biosynthetic enzyme